VQVIVTAFEVYAPYGQQQLVEPNFIKIELVDFGIAKYPIVHSAVVVSISDTLKLLV
jgi:hypothetical protein